jgi:hypothetical protein
MRIVGSMTTLPDRINHLNLILNSIITQRRKLDKFYLNIPYKSLKNKEYIIPEYIKENKEITIVRCKDYGPLTKLIPVLDIETDENTYIITFDDDRIVNRNVTSIIERKINEYPNCALSFSGWCVGYFPFYFQSIKDNTEDLEVDWIQGCHTITYKRDMIDKEDLLNFQMKNMSKYIFRHDDHRIAIHLNKRGVKRICIGKKADLYFKETNNSRIEPISGGNSILKVIEFFYQVAMISMKLKSMNIYKRHHSISDSYIVKKISTILLSCLIILAIVIFYKKIEFF